MIRALCAGLAGGLAGNLLLGLCFTSPWVHSILYDPARQSALFLELTPQRDIALSVAGLVVLSAVHGVLFVVLSPSMPGSTRVAKGAFWGLVIWAMYWLFQEWFIYHTLLREPLLLCLLELAILLGGALVEGLVIAAAAPRAGTSP